MGSRWPPFVKLVLGLCIAVVMLQQVYIWRLGAKTEPSVSSALPGMHVIDKLQHVQGQDVTTTFRPKNISEPPKQPALRAANREGRQDAKPVRNKKRHGKFSGAEDLRIVFLHVRKTGGSTAWALLRKLLPKQYKDPCLCSIKSPPMYSTRCEEEARIEASNSTSSLGAAFASGSDIAQLGGVERILENAGYSQEWISDLSSHARSVMQDNFVAASQVGDLDHVLPGHSNHCVVLVTCDIPVDISSTGGTVSSRGIASLGYICRVDIQSPWIQNYARRSRSYCSS